MKDQLAKLIRDALEGGGADAAVFLVETDGGLMPCVVSDPGDERISLACTGDERYPIAGFAAMLADAGVGRLALVARECDRRMIVELAKHNKLDPGRVVSIPVPCSQELADACSCDHPVPPGCAIETDTRPVEATAEETSPASSDDPLVRYDYWMDHFERCLRCYGCRNVCPLCYCNDCALDNPNLVGPDMYPPDVPIFHLIRAIDMADRCVDCGMCESICPAEIPLRELYHEGRRVMREAFGYEPGLDPDEKSPLETIGDRAELDGIE